MLVVFVRYNPVATELDDSHTPTDRFAASPHNNRQTRRVSRGSKLKYEVIHAGNKFICEVQACL